MSKINDTLVSFFSSLEDGYKKNLLYHAKKGTPICCGANFLLYTDGKGGG